MRGFCAIFRLELTALVRSKTLAMLAFASVAWMFVLPKIATGDGTAEGARELWISYSLGGVFALLVIALLASATGAIARERESRRLALTTVRPVRYVVIVLAKASALTLAGAVVLAAACAALPFSAQTSLSCPCRHVVGPVLPSPRAEAEEAYEGYMRDPSTPEAIRKAKPEVVLRLLESRAAEHYFAIRTNATSRWRFELPAGVSDGLGVRVRFAGICDSRRDAYGVFRFGERSGVVSNLTQTVLEVPLRGNGPCGERAEELTFENRGRETLMLRPRKDIELLVPADTLGWNLLRAYVEMVGVLALVISFGLFLSASLGRPVALFVSMVVLIVGEMSPSLVETCQDELEMGAADRIGLEMTRLVADVTRPVSALNPIGRLATDACIEWREVVRVVLFDLLLAPLILAVLAGLALPRKSS